MLPCICNETRQTFYESGNLPSVSLLSTNYAWLPAYNFALELSICNQGLNGYIKFYFKGGISGHRNVDNSLTDENKSVHDAVTEEATRWKSDLPWFARLLQVEQLEIQVRTGTEQFL